MEEGGDGTAGGKGKGGKGKGGKVSGRQGIDVPKRGGAVQATEPPGVLVERDVVFGKSEEGADLFLDLWRRGPTNGGESVGDVELVDRNEDFNLNDKKKDKASAVLWIHGGGWKGGNKNHIPACVLPVLAQGIVVASVGYRKSTSAPFPACIRDCKAAVRYLRAASDQLQIDPERIGVIGSSAGGHLGLLLAFLDERLEESDAGSARCSSAVQAIVDIAGPTDLRMEENSSQDASLESLLLGGHPSAVPLLSRLASPMYHLECMVDGSGDKASIPPMLVLHGSADDEVPHDSSARFVQLLEKVSGNQVKFVSIPGGTHCRFGLRNWAPEEERSKWLEAVDLEMIPFLRRHLRV